MRSAVLLPVLLLPAFFAVSGCASPTPEQRWRAIQRERFERLHAVRAPALALRRVLAAADDPSALERSAPAVVSPSRPDVQDPQPKLDQRLPPPRTGAGAFQDASDPVVASVDVGVGTASAKLGSSRFDDRTNARSVRVRVERQESGAALAIEAWGSDDHLFAGRFASDGAAPRPADSRVVGVDVFPHVRLDGSDDDAGGLRVPVRLGAFSDWQRLSGTETGVDREWLGFGPRIVVEPTLPLVSQGERRLELVTRFGCDVGPSWFAEHHRSGGSRDSTWRVGAELGLGLSAAFGDVSAELGYRLRHTTFGPLDGDLYGSIDRTELQRQQLYLGFGLTW